MKAEAGRRACRGSCCGNPLVAELRGIPCNRRILLVGNPNVGKSVLFTRLTGVHAISSNYPGTTVGFSEGRLAFGNSCFHLIDVPGAYTLDPTNEAEDVARRIVDEGAEAIIVVLDSTALERNLYLALQVLERGLPVVVALNMVDEARHKGIAVDASALAEALGVPVVPTVAVTGQGINELVRALEERTRRAAPEAHSPAETTPPATLRSAEERWLVIGSVIQRVQRVTHRHHTWRDKLEDASVDRIWGGLIALAVILGSYSAIRLLGEGLIDHLLDPLANRLLLPLLEKLSAALGGEGLLHHILIGRLVDGAIDFEQSFGMLTTGLYVEFVMVLPYVTAFYTVLSFLEDFGYLPRLAVFFDALLHRLGLHGFAIIPTLLGLGCNVPGILATRVLESPRERFIAATLISVAVPCAGLQAMAVGVLGDLGGQYVLIPYAVLAVSWVILGRILHLVLPGYSPELIVEIPPYRLPSPSGLLLKLWFRIKGFLLEATPLVLGGVLLVNLLTMAGIVQAAARLTAPLFQGVLGLPPEAAGPLLLGILRKDVAVGMLVPLGLSPQQLVVAVVTLAMTFPCIATFIVLWRELGGRRLAASMGIMFFTAFAAGGLLHALFSLAGR